MSDPRFARLKNDPRFRRIRKKEHKVVVDDRFKDIFDDGKKKKDKKGKGRVDKYGRPLADTQERDNLRRFYRLENQDEEGQAEPEATAGPDYARGQVLLESSDEEDDRDDQAPDEDSDTGGIITLGRDISKPIPVQGDDEAEIDLDEGTYADLDAQAAAYARDHPEPDSEAASTGRTRRLAVVNLDWDHVRAIHLYKIFSSLVSPTATATASTSVDTRRKRESAKAPTTTVVRGKVLSVRVYPSEFGKQRMAREEKEGPPPELFKKSVDDEEEINERTIFEVGNGEDYDEDMLRKYQLERLRYYYAIVKCDTVDAALHIYSELEGTELERSANIFDLSFVPDDMTFDDEYRDEATDDLNAPYKPVEFVTDALRHSKVKLTWDEDDPDRVEITRRNLSRKEIEENDFRAHKKSKDAKAASRDKLRALLLRGGDDELPEGWGKDRDAEEDVDMEITFTPGLSAMKEDRDETTLEKYQRKMKEKKKKRKEEIKEKAGATREDKDALKDDFFADDSEDDSGAELHGSEDEDVALQRGKKQAKGKKSGQPSQTPAHATSTAEELALIVASDNPAVEPNHFNMKAVLKAEKKSGRKKKGKRGKKDEEENELQEDFSINVKDERFKAVLEDHTFAIDPSNPHFKKTKSMAALLQERSTRQQEKLARGEATSQRRDESNGQSSLQSLVESVKRKSAAMEEQGVGKRRKV
ncbi:protein ESF1 [Grifola frondosa]|uniref:Protein ESF1 n=1 Tax=Grifola frondosa TaxID=5627 RepID=A0A1C7MQC7_GRIFR|nr:protein ESF1 [Grifola frondosa]